MKRVIIYCIVWALIWFLGGSDKTIFILQSLLIFISASIEALIMYRRYGIVALLSPFVVCCLYMFTISFGISNFIFVIPGYEQYFEYLAYEHFKNLEDFYYCLTHSLNYIIAGFIALVTGYYLEERMKLVTSFTQTLFQGKHLLVKEFDIKLWKIILLWAFSCLIKIFAIVKGLYGFTASSIALEENKGIVQFLAYGIMLSKAALFFLCLLYFTRAKNTRLLTVLVVVVFVELIFGLLSGFKSQLMFPFIIILFSNIVVTNRIKIKFIIPIVISLFIAYALVEPMRAASYGYESDKKVGTSELIELATTGVKEKTITEDNAVPFFYVFMYRNSLSMFVAISEKEANHNHRFYPDFDISRKILFAPILAFVPRALWPDKPTVSNGGVLYNRLVLGASDSDNVSVATSPVGYFLLGTQSSLLYTIGFFLLLGMLQYYIFYLYLNYGLGGLIVCVGMLMTFGIVEEPHFVLISYFKDLPVFIFFQFLFLYPFKKRSRVALSTS